jgi:NAD(P)H dehydrogenase (quinone)
MAKVIVVYESRYGNTKHVAESIIEGINEVGVVEVSLKELKEVDFKEIPFYDAILIGSPNHVGGPTRGIKGFIDKLGKLPLEGKKFAVFDTYPSFGEKAYGFNRGMNRRKIYVLNLPSTR